MNPSLHSVVRSIVGIGRSNNSYAGTRETPPTEVRDKKPEITGGRTRTDGRTRTVAGPNLARVLRLLTNSL